MSAVSLHERDILEDQIGSLGRFQILTVISCYIVEIFVAMNMFSHGIMVPETIAIYCSNTNKTITDMMSPEELADLRKEACREDCPEIIVSSIYYDNTIVHQYKLYCDGRHLFTTGTQFIFMSGIFVGNFVFGMLGSKFGRKIPLIVSIMGQPVFGIGVAMSPNIYCFLFFKFVLSLFVGGTMTNCFILYIELVGVKWRTFVGIIAQIFYALGHLLLALLGYLHSDWRWFQLSISLPAGIFLHLIWTLPESPRWLFSVNKVEQGIAQVTAIARINRLPTEHIRDQILKEIKMRTISHSILKEGTFADQFTNPAITMVTIGSWINWFSVTCCYFGIPQFTGSLASNLYMSFALSAIAQQPSVLVLLYTLNHWGRKWSLLFSNSLACVCLICIILVPWEEYKIIPVSITMFALGMSFPSLFVYTVELFPTAVRTIGMGCCSALGSIGAMLAAGIADLTQVRDWLPPAIFAILMVLATLAILLLPETKGHVLPERVADINNLMDENIFWCKNNRRSF